MTSATPGEAKTRKELIDPALEKAGWDLGNPDQVGIEIPVDGFDPAAWHTLEIQLREARVAYTVDLPAGVTDYSLYRPNGEIIAVVEAKRTSVDPRLAQAQTQFYVTQLEQRQSFRPFAFMANGQDIYFWDAGRANKRLVMGFFSPDDLENLLYLRQNQTPLTAASVNTKITNRSYQLEAVRRVVEAFEQGKRKALLVMATGTGKTRVAMSLADVFLRSNQARRILFVADRDALVSQAIGEGFEEHIPDEPCTRIFTYDIDKTKRLYAVTLQTLSNCLGQFTPGFFDLIIFDEVHRSIFNKWNEVLQYFDGRMVGLTATPAAFLDRNTFLEFECYDAKPTFLYGHEEAVRDGYLVDFDLYAAQTKFQRKGIKGVDLSEEERNSLIDQGLDPDAIDYSGTDLEQRVSNADTLRKQWQEIMDVCRKDESGQLPGKTIVFAMTQDHALRLAAAFEEMYPQFPGLAQVITYKSEYKGTLIDTFKKESFPRIAISVDMLETGVNVPEAVNLVFMRPVQSRIKLEQMIGHGTRNNAACTHPAWLPNGRKEDFLVVDFWENNFGKTAQEEPLQSLPVLVALFNTRLKLLENYLGDQWSDEAMRVKADLRAMIERIPRNSYSVKLVLPQIEQVWDDFFWQFLTVVKIDLLRLKVGPLLRNAPDVDVAKETFTHKVERLKRHVKKLVESNRLDGVISMPGGVFKPYAGVSTAVLFFTKGASTERIWFYDMAHDGFSLDDKRQPVAENDLPDILACWRNRKNPEFLTQRQSRLETLQVEVAPLKAERLRLAGEINRLTFESVIAANGDEPIHAELDAAKEELAKLVARIAPIQQEMNQLSRQFWVTKAQVKGNGYDLTASRYRQVEQDEAHYEKPQVTMERLLALETIMTAEVQHLQELVQ